MSCLKTISAVPCDIGISALIYDHLAPSLFYRARGNQSWGLNGTLFFYSYLVISQENLESPLTEASVFPAVEFSQSGKAEDTARHPQPTWDLGCWLLRVEVTLYFPTLFHVWCPYLETQAEFNPPHSCFCVLFGRTNTISSGYAVSPRFSWLMYLCQTCGISPVLPRYWEHNPCFLGLWFTGGSLGIVGVQLVLYSLDPILVTGSWGCYM